jgi:NADP-dependent 3-hydroxy acid dehydrogenase YdfG
VQLSLTDQAFLVTVVEAGRKGVAAAVVAAGGTMLIGRNADRLAGAADEIKAVSGTGSVTLNPPTSSTRGGRPRYRGSRHAEPAGCMASHCAGGGGTIGPIPQVDSDAWRRTVDLNINGTMYAKHSARTVRGGGRSFIGISSIAASNTHQWFGAYGVSSRQSIT